MKRRQIIEELLKTYVFTKDEERIVRFLSDQKASAQVILKNTPISSGRIYRLLKGLEKTGLIVKEGVKPTIYSMEPLKECVSRYLEYKLKESTHAQKEILDAISSLEDAPTAEIIHGTKRTFDIEIINMNTSCKWLNLAHKDTGVPWFMYALLPDKDFFLVRDMMAKQREIGSSSERFDLDQKRASYIELYENRKVEHVMQKQALESFKETILKAFPHTHSSYIQSLNKQLTKYNNVKIFVSETLSNPFSIYVYDKEVIMPIFTKKNQNRMIRMKGKEYIQIYTDYFQSIKKNAKKLDRFML